MTIIVFDATENVVFVDSKHTFNSGRQHETATKIHWRDGHAIATAGFAIPCAAVEDCVLDMLQAGEMRRPLAGFASDVSVSGFARHSDGTVYSVGYACGWVDLVKVSRLAGYIAEGAGSNWLDAYIAIGMTIREAVHKVAEHHTYCGLPISEF